MRLLSRPEVWFLLLASAVAAWWALRDPEPYAQDEAEIATTTAADAVLRIHRCTLERDFGNARLDIEFRFRNTSPRPLLMQPPDVRLLTDDGREIPAFILPVEKPPVAPENAASDLRLRYWLEAKDLSADLRLDVRGQSVEVKSKEPLDLEKLENARPKTWTTTKWVP
ncbi:MAG: hypothetical protein JNG86_15285 [Verrucomicrobiaceae bacterium]|nr:hypothetical protein [Verrucomicrobiaceae bacterium]